MEQTAIHRNLTLRKRYPLLGDIIKYKFLLLMFMPGFIYYFIFEYLPMFGILIAFKDYSVFRGVFASPWAGLYYFRLFFNDPYFFRLIRNTLLLNTYVLFFGFPAPILLAVLLNELANMKFKRVVQTITYVPHFISTTIIIGITVNFLSPTSGIFNTLLGMFFRMEPIYFMADPKYFRTVYVVTDIWQSVGFGTIVFLATIAGIDQQLYEACRIDGGGRFKQFLYVTLPGLLPTAILLFLLNLGRIMNVSRSKVIQLYNPLIYETSDVISTYVYRVGLMAGRFSFGAAIDLFNNMIGFVLLLTANSIARRVSEHSLW